MTYSVKELYYTLQGEGIHSGRPAVFLRFTGCNLWTGMERDRQRGPGGCSAWCDTDFVGIDGPGGGRFESSDALAAATLDTWHGGARSRPFVVCTGGEPLLQLNYELVEALHKRSFEVAVETNGTLLPPSNVDWVCVSPKAGTSLTLKTGNELKLVYPQPGAEPECFEELDFDHFLLQPLDCANRQENTMAALKYCLAHPQWRLSQQSHKYLQIP